MYVYSARSLKCATWCVERYPRGAGRRDAVADADDVEVDVGVDVEVVVDDFFHGARDVGGDDAEGVGAEVGAEVAGLERGAAAARAVGRRRARGDVESAREVEQGSNGDGWGGEQGAEVGGERALESARGGGGGERARRAADDVERGVSRALGLRDRTALGAEHSG